MTNLPEKTAWVRNGALAEYFGVSAMCIWRWKRDPSLNCPPTFEVNGIEWNDIQSWDAWMRKRGVKYTAEKSKPSRAERFHKNKKKATRR
jgi:hypothetical protein